MKLQRVHLVGATGHEFPAWRFGRVALFYADPKVDAMGAGGWFAYDPMTGHLVESQSLRSVARVARDWQRGEGRE